MTEQKIEHPALSKLEAIAITPRRACELLAIGNTRLYQLIGEGELRSYLDGRARRILVAPIHEYVARRLAAEGATGAATQAAPLRKRGRPRNQS
ncbi:MAG TPA: excisionase family DNA-binding protein [Xanthobacteraceae bacterium]|nr:excisionase family DNA-binding protein [Xanthobacteraceae bacterium]